MTQIRLLMSRRQLNLIQGEPGLEGHFARRMTKVQAYPQPACMFHRRCNRIELLAYALAKYSLRLLELQLHGPQRRF